MTDIEQSKTGYRRREFMAGVSLGPLVVPAGLSVLGSAAQAVGFGKNSLLAPRGKTWDQHLLAKPVLRASPMPALSDAAAWQTIQPGWLKGGVLNSQKTLVLGAPMMDAAMFARLGASHHGYTSYVREGGGAIFWRHHFASSQNWSGFNRLYMRIKPRDTGLAAYRLVLGFASSGAGTSPGDPLALHFLPGLKPGVWNDVVWEFDELHRSAVTQLAIILPLVGPLSGKAEYEIEGFTLQKTEPEHILGWNVADKRIACNLIGYETAGAKRALSQPGGSSFDLMDAGSGTVVGTYPAIVTKGKGGPSAVLDFTSFNRPGRYVLRYGDRKSPPFKIGGGVALELIEPLLNFFYADRCGCAVPGLHGICHTEVFVEHKGQRKPVNGGWHDAGNLSQGAYRTSLATSALFETYDALGSVLPPRLQSRLIEEGSWGLDWLLRTRFGGGFRVVNAGYAIMQDGTASSGDEIGGVADDAPFESFVFASTALLAARVLAKSDPARAKEASAAAKEDYDAAIKRLPADLSQMPEDPNFPHPHSLLAYAVIAAVDLHTATGQSTYAQDAVRLARDLSFLQEQGLTNDLGITGYYNRDRAGVRRAIDYHSSFADAPTIAFSKLSSALPTHPDRAMWRAAVSLESDCFLQRGASETAPFNYVPTAVWKKSDIEPYVARAVKQIELAKNFGPPDITPAPTEAIIRQNLAAELKAAVRLGDAEWLRTFPIAEDQVFHGSGTIQLARALALVNAGRLRGRVDLVELGRQQLDWQLGLNPFCMSMVFGVVDRTPSQMLLWADDIVGAVPVGMDARHDVPFWPHTCHMASREMWVVPAAKLLALIAALHKAQHSGPAISLQAEQAGDDVRITLHGARPGRGDLRMLGYNIIFNETSRAGEGQLVWTGCPVDPSKGWVAQLETSDSLFIADIVGGRGIQANAAGIR